MPYSPSPWWATPAALIWTSTCIPVGYGLHRLALGMEEPLIAVPLNLLGAILSGGGITGVVYTLSARRMAKERTPPRRPLALPPPVAPETAAGKSRKIQ